MLSSVTLDGTSPQANFVSRDFNDPLHPANRDLLGLKMKPNVTMQCFFGEVATKPDRFGPINITGFDTAIPI